MKKYISTFAILALFSLEAAEFQHKTWVTVVENDAGPRTYLAHFTIDKIMAENTAPERVTSPQVLCVEGQESVVSKKADADAYTVKALIYQEAGKTKAKTSIVLEENNEVVYTVEEVLDVESNA